MEEIQPAGDKIMTRYLWHVTTNYYCAGMVSQRGRIIRTAPILKKYKGWTETDAYEELEHKAQIIIEQIQEDKPCQGVKVSM